MRPCGAANLFFVRDIVYRGGRTQANPDAPQRISLRDSVISLGNRPFSSAHRADFIALKNTWAKWLRCFLMPVVGVEPTRV